MFCQKLEQLKEAESGFKAPNIETIFEHLECSIDECLMVCLSFFSYTITMIVIYNPPRIKKPSYVHQLENELEKLAIHTKAIIICGDINIDVTEPNSLISH